MKFCPKCGKALLDDAIVCEDCNYQFAAEQEAPQAVADSADQTTVLNDLQPEAQTAPQPAPQAAPQPAPQVAPQPAPQAAPQQPQGFAQPNHPPVNPVYGQPMNQGHAQPNRPPVNPAYGQPMYQNPAPAKQEESQGIAIAALVCLFLFQPAALILGIMGLKKYEKGSSSRTMCLVATILSAIALVFAVGSVVIFFLMAILSSGLMYY